MLITVRYGDVSKPINSNCKCGVILEHLRKVANIGPTVVLDLCDKDGVVKGLRPNPITYANTMLASGEKYFLVSAVDDGKQYNYQILANLTAEEGKIEVKPTKVDKKETIKKNPPRSAKGKKGK